MAWVMPRITNYDRIISQIFKSYDDGTESFVFPRTAIAEAADAANVSLPKNVGDVIYTFRARRDLPAEIRERAGVGREWIIRSVGVAQYEFIQVRWGGAQPSASLAETKIPDSTPALIEKYSQSDEQALLAVIRYNRLIDVFTKLSCFSVQNHLRTSLDGIGQVEVDELYVGIDRRGAHYVLPIEVKSRTDRLGAAQVSNLFAVASQKFPLLIPRPIGAQFITDDLIALFEFERGINNLDLSVVSEKHYRLAPADEISDELIKQYASRPDD
jgi:hypothetical protein